MTTIQTDHRPRYEAALQAYRLQRRGTEPDTHWKALLLIATATPSLWEKVRPYLELDRGNAHLERFKAEQDLSGGERRLIELAHNLHNGGCKVDIGDLIDTLDSTLWPVALEAMLIRRGVTKDG